jgi:transposase
VKSTAEYARSFESLCSLSTLRIAPDLLRIMMRDVVPPRRTAPAPALWSQTRPTPIQHPSCVAPTRDPRGHPGTQRPGRPPQGQRLQGGRPRAFDAQTYRGRNVIERCFNKMKEWRGIATRHDRLAVTYLAEVVLAAIFRCWLR